MRYFLIFLGSSSTSSSYSLLINSSISSYLLGLFRILYISRKRTIYLFRKSNISSSGKFAISFIILIFSSFVNISNFIVGHFAIFTTLFISFSNLIIIYMGLFFNVFHLIFRRNGKIDKNKRNYYSSCS